MSRFVWLRRFEVDRNSADINGLLDRLEFLQGFDLPSDLLETVSPHRITRLRSQGERYFTDGLRDISGDRRLAILAVCAVEWRGTIADAVVETHDRIVGQTFRSAKRCCDERLRMRGLHCTIPWTPSGPLERRCSKRKGTACPWKRPSRRLAAGRSSKALSRRLSN